ncbi:MAG: right-handed parallel beta-helix repeat-containing protein, partial [Clostridia bacterium]|nr:right-handed parallel beta-helix repeat-containing protein [Clostridia bacterium]
MAITVQKTFHKADDWAKLSDGFAQIKAAASSATAEKPLNLTVELPNGATAVRRPLTLSARENPGLAYVSLTIRGQNGMRPVLTGLKTLPKVPVQTDGQGDYVYSFPPEDGEAPSFRELFVSNRLLEEAKGEPFVHPFSFADYGGRDGMTEGGGIYVPREQASLFAGKDTEGLLLCLFVEWEFYAVHVAGFDFSSVREKDGKEYVLAKIREDEFAPMVSKIHPILNIDGRNAYFYNHPALFGEKEAFALDVRRGKLTFRLHTPIASYASVSYPAVEQIFGFEGMRNVTLRGLTFTGTSSGYMGRNGYFSEQANGEKRAGKLPHAAVLTNDVRDFTVEDCTFLALGGNGILMQDKTVNARIVGNTFTHIAMSGICMGNRTAKWDDEKNRQFALTVENNTLTHIGYGYPSSAAIFVGMADGLSLCRNTIKDTSYSAVSVGWFRLPEDDRYPGETVCIRRAEIAYNRISDYMRLLRDGAAIYVMGMNAAVAYAGALNTMHHNYAEQTEVKDASSRGYYLDASSSNWEVYDNVCVGSALPVFSQFHVKSQYTHHN